MVQRNDLSIYDRNAADWWDDTAPAFRSLHTVNAYRLDLLDRWLGDEPSGAILDIGCGGGLLSEPMSRRADRVVGLDISLPSLRVARDHARSTGNTPHYLCADARQLPFRNASFTGVLLADVVEHVAPIDTVLSEVGRVLQPGGWVFVNTINRTWRAHWLVAELAEWLRFIPRGTHDAAMFVRPDELERAANAAGLHLVHSQGETIQLIKTIVSWRLQVQGTNSTALGYSALFRKSNS